MTSGFVLQNIVTGLVLNIFSSGGPGTPVVTYLFPAGWNENELWNFNGSYIVSTLDGNVLDINCPWNEGSQLIVSELSSDSQTQQWTFEENTGYIRNQNGLVVTVFENESGPGKAVILANASEQDGQKFQMIAANSTDPSQTYRMNYFAQNHKGNKIHN